MASFSMKKTFFALAALAAPTFADVNDTESGVGYAIVENKCPYDVYVNNVPSAGGGFDQISYTLKSNGRNNPYKFQYTQLSNQNGWSIKLSKSASDWSDIMQFETTFHNDGKIWYDLSDVNGNPWNGNWMITAKDNEGCNPKRQAYRYSTDDAYGMQACEQDATLTVTLCSADEAAAGEASSASSSAASDSNTSETAATSYSAPPAPVVSSVSSPSFSAPVVPSISAPAVSAPIEVQTTLQTTASPSSSSSSVADAVATVTEIIGTTTFVTKTWQGAATDFPGRQKRDAEADEYARAHEHLKRHQEAHHKHHGHF